MLHKSTVFAATALMITLASGSAFAEDAALGGIGVKFGGAFTNATFTGTGADAINEAVNDDIGYNIGLQAVFGINDYIAIQPELHYINKGYQLPLSLGGTLVSESTANLDYIQLPVLASLRLPLIRAFTPKVLVGPHVAYKIGGNTNTKVGSTETRTQHKPEDYNTIDVGLTLGAGFDVGLDAFTLNVELRYELGLLPVYSGEPSSNMTHNQVGFMLGLLI